MCLMLTALVVVQYNTRRATMASRELTVDSSPHAIALDSLQQHDNDGYDEHIQEDHYYDTLFSPSNIKQSTKTICGSFKCFYHDEFNASIGYLVTPLYSRPRQQQSWFEYLQNSYNHALTLQQLHNISHFLLEPPMKVKVTHELSYVLNYNLYSEGRGMAITKERFKLNSTVVIQKVKMAPSSFILLGSSHSKRKLFMQSLEKFVSRIQDVDAFSLQFTASLQQTQQLFRSEPCLAYDFQVYLDTSGNFHHFDLDRCQQHRGKDATTLQTLASLDIIEMEMNKALGTKEKKRRR